MLLSLGVILWALVHLSASLVPQFRQRLIDSLGAGLYKGLFALAILASLGMIVTGWKSFVPSALYTPPAGLRHATMLLMPFAFILFLAARIPTDLKQYIRHPQLAGVKLWALAHLLANGETRSVILFSGLLAWAVLEVIFINKRDQTWQKPQRVGFARSLLQIIIAVAITGAVVFGHQWLAGVPLLPSS